MLAAPMRSWLATILLSCLPLAYTACRSGPEPPQQSGPEARGSVALPFDLSPRVERPISSAVVAFEKTLQATKLLPPALGTHSPRLAFGRGVLGQLSSAELRVFDSTDFRLVATVPVESPRALLAMADGSLLVVGARAIVRWEPDKKRPTTLPRPVLLPDADLYADPQQADVLWVFDAVPRGGGEPAPPTLSRYRLTASEARVLLPEQVELALPRGGVFGPTREGVWLYATAGHVERLSPGGLRLSGVTLGEQTLPTWMLPARRLDQSLWLEESGNVARVLVSPGYKQLARAKLAGKALSADVGDQGRLLAAVVVTGPGPRFELELVDQDLAPLGRAVLPTDEPTGMDDWVQVVTANQNVVVARAEPRVAVGGPSRVSIFDARGNLLFSIPSR
jgi:hypothetical protein